MCANRVQSNEVSCLIPFSQTFSQRRGESIYECEKKNLLVKQIALLNTNGDVIYVSGYYGAWTKMLIVPIWVIRKWMKLITLLRSSSPDDMDYFREYLKKVSSPLWRKYALLRMTRSILCSTSRNGRTTSSFRITRNDLD